MGENKNETKAGKECQATREGELKTTNYCETDERQRERLKNNRVEEAAVYGLKAEPWGNKTLEDYLALPEEARVEMIDGVFYDMAGPTTVHTKIGVELYGALQKHIKQNGGKCIPFIAPTDVQLDCDDKTMVQPDVFVVCNPNRKLYPWVVGAPDLVVEVVSPGNRSMDVFKKRYKYEKAGVREYWMIFPEERKVIVCLFEKGETKEYTFEDKIPVGIWGGKCEIDFAEIYEAVKFLYDFISTKKETSSPH